MAIVLELSAGEIVEAIAVEVARWIEIVFLIWAELAKISRLDAAIRGVKKLEVSCALMNAEKIWPLTIVKVANVHLEMVALAKVEIQEGVFRWELDKVVAEVSDIEDQDLAGGLFIKDEVLEIFGRQLASENLEVLDTLELNHFLHRLPILKSIKRDLWIQVIA